MSSMTYERLHAPADVTLAAQQACAAIAPNWPLDRSIAVNPYWMLREHTFAAVAEEMRLLAGSRMTMPLPYYKEQWDAGIITQNDLDAANAEAQAGFGLEELLHALHHQDEFSAIPLYSDMLDRRRNADHQTLWREHITTQISQCCASFFDQFQADWRLNKSDSLYRYWLETITSDRGGALLMGDSSWRKRSHELPSSSEELLNRAADCFALPPDQLVRWFRASLERIHGWASWCAFLAWQANLHQEQDPGFLYELLAVRIAWELILWDGNTSPRSALTEWQRTWHADLSQPLPDSHKIAQVWLRAHEISYQRELKDALEKPTVSQQSTPEVQAIFCIDVRSEPVRRHIEWAHPGYETIGFAGFFGIPMNYQPLGAREPMPHLPGLFAGQYLGSDSTGDAARDADLRKLSITQNAQSWLRSWHGRLPASSFDLVETEGPLKLLTLWKQSFGSGKPALNSAKGADPDLHIELDATIEEKAGMAARLLRATGLHRRIAPAVLVVGHTARTTNNPQASALDCGACCGQNGLTNARALTSILNDPLVRRALNANGVAIPDATIFVAGVHNTTINTITLDPRDRARLARDTAIHVEAVLEDACASARQESAIADSNGSDSSFIGSLTKRAFDWAELRPEWGLVNNACLIVGPRERTRGLDLKGRSFLHEYDVEDDVDGYLLAQILSGPMVVANWINLQYFASCVDPTLFGSGNKTLHNVVGGHIGVFEGNGGDLRIGLARQSVHDGQRWRHDPIRLTVVVYASRTHVEAALHSQEVAQQLVRGKWLYLFAKDGEKLERICC